MSAAQVALVLHDVAPATWTACERLLRALSIVPGDALTLLVVPHYHRGRRCDEPAFRRALDPWLAGGAEVALHGYVHHDDAHAPRAAGDWFRRRVLTAGEGEFAALARDEAAARIDAGLALMARCGWTPQGFVAPAWWLSPGARQALSQSRLRWCGTRTGLHALPDWRALRAPALGYSARSAWRRSMSPSIVELQRRAADRDCVPVRLALHPADAAWPALIEHASGIWRRLRERRVPVCESRLLDALQRDSGVPDAA